MEKDNAGQVPFAQKVKNLIEFNMTGAAVLRELVELGLNDRVPWTEASDLAQLVEPRAEWGAYANPIADFARALQKQASKHFRTAAFTKDWQEKHLTEFQKAAESSLKVASSNSPDLSRMNPLEHRCANLFRICQGFVDKKYFSPGVFNDSIAAVRESFVIRESAKNAQTPGKILAYHAGYITRFSMKQIYMAIAHGNPKTVAPLLDVLADFVRKVPEQDRRIAAALYKRASRNPALQRARMDALTRGKAADTAPHA